jgi:hypothetical protein
MIEMDPKKYCGKVWIGFTWLRQVGGSIVIAVMD